MAKQDPTRNLAGFIEIQQHLSGVDYPADKDDLIATAAGHDAPENVMDALRQIEDRTYESPADVSKAVGDLT